MKMSLKMIYLLHVCLDSNKQAQLYLKDDLKSLLRFDDLVPIFKVTSQITKVDFIVKMRYFLNKLTDIHET